MGRRVAVRRRSLGRYRLLGLVRLLALVRLLRLLRSGRLLPGGHVRLPELARLRRRLVSAGTTGGTAVVRHRLGLPPRVIP
ncbi:hypothetical protein [Streptomyces sp. NPDC046332]|uniref:hypothetical protein n=1 Tax=unclassified Streptomyces TaxID=2593676 RepID=UPI0033C707A9